MDLNLDRTVALVTGAASGIGRATVLALLGENVRVCLIDLDTAARVFADELAAAGHDVLFVQADVTEEASVADAVEAAVAQFGGIDSVICCAGISGPFGRGIENIAVEEWNAVLAVNVTGPFLVVKHALPALRASAAPTVVVLASDSSFVAAPGMVPYNASKGAVLQLTRALSVDLAGDGIRVNCICPSIVDTAMSRTDLGLGDEGFRDADYPVQSADEVAQHALYLSSSRSRPVNGHALVSDFGYLARSSFPA